ncbi:XRE family transcriptional regulator [Anaerocolumna sedimenticola]|uniref:XRE family transcriptional regulator n=1 Tax=Anaerocolumna sedimenticola TaxID=2696063 RepID=A0A6P1TMF5_9FIRM|nr:helix-turn-helix transcriptional regulator [Anaerocolumna sedimenticola]QHQ61359.1 XRE family transcriptional regulator [Anaerocolumna sedimenticola]
MDLRDRIRALANEKGMSLPDLENTLGFGNGTIVKWDKSTPNVKKLGDVADFFGVSIDYLTGRVEGRSDTVSNEDNVDNASYEDLLKIYTRGKNNLTPQEKMKLAQIILSDED